MAKRYRKHGLDKSARQIVEFLQRRGLAGATVLEVGGGVGEIQLELLKRGAGRTVNLELSAGYEQEAARLVREAGVEGRVERRIHDVAVDPAAVEPVDIVVLHRVVCCYPDLDALLGAAADRAQRQLVLTYPPHNALSRRVISLLNLVQRLRRHEFRVFVWPRREIARVAEDHGLTPVREGRASPLWRWAAFERQPQVRLP